MFCKHCGREIDDKAIVCPYCGVQVANVQPQQSGTNVIAIVGFIFAFIMPIVGLICSIIGRNKAYEYGGNGRGLATAGLVINIIWLLIAVISGIAVGCAVADAISQGTYY